MSTPDAVDAKRAPAPNVAGVYTVADDGWLAVLTLSQGDGGDLSGNLFSVRFGRSFDVTGRIDAADLGRVELAVHGFNQVARQDYVGYLVGGPTRAVAGFTSWGGRPFGFFARQAPFLHLSQYGALGDVVEQKDFVGRYTIWTAEGVGTLDVWLAPGGLAGRYIGSDGSAVDALIGGGRYAYEAQIAFEHRGSSFDGRGYLFTRPKNALAGTASWQKRTTGFYMVKVRGGES